MKKNLLKETLEVLWEHGKKPEDVKWCGKPEYGWCTWDEFCSVAKDIEYDSGYGTAMIAENLLIVGEDWWLERREYDGAEWWVFKTLPVKPKVHRVPMQVLKTLF